MDEGWLADDRLVAGAVCSVEAAAMAASRWLGRGDERAADEAAVAAMRSSLGALPFQGEVVIGEGERDAAPMLYRGERLGKGGPAVAIAVDPLEGTRLTAKGCPEALVTLAIAGAGDLLCAPDVYMEKRAMGPGYPLGLCALETAIGEVIGQMAECLGRRPSEITVSILERARHKELIAEVRAAGARIRLIPDGDIAAAILAARPDSDIDLYVGTGGAPEGVLAAAALSCLGGQFYGRLVFRDQGERARAAACGIRDLERSYALCDLARGALLFLASGVSDGALVPGVRTADGGLRVTTRVLCSRVPKQRRIESWYPLA